MLSEKWISASRADELIELRELVHLAADPKFAQYMALPNGSVSSDGSAVIGRAGHVFVNDGSNRWREQLAGSATIDAASRDKTVFGLDASHGRAQELGIQFRFAVVPEKDVIYSEFSPNAKGKVSGNRPVVQLQSKLGDIMVYPAADLLAHAELVRTYHVRNSHVSFFGGLILADAILASLQRPGLDENAIETEPVYWPDDLSIKWVAGLNTRRRILKKRFEEEVVAKVEGHVGTYLIFRNAFARTQETLVLFGDSYAWNPDAGLARLLSFEFATVHFVWQKTVDWDLVERVQPTAILLQSAERFLIRGVGL